MAGYSGPVIDVDVHHGYNGISELHEYFPAEWRDLIVAGFPVVLPIRHYPAQFGYRRLDTFSKDGKLPDVARIQQQLLDPLGIERVILSFNTGSEVGHENPYIGAALAVALDNWSIDRWLSGQDDRFYGAVVACSRLPEEAAKEIRRVGDHPRIVEVLLPDGGLGQPFGHPVYHPIYEAAAEYKLPVAIHVGANSRSGIVQLNAGGLPSSTFEWYSALNQAAMHHVTSFIVHGVFEKFPALKLAVLEGGINWVPWMARQLDSAYPRLRRETPWVKKLPSEYLRNHVRFSTQPMEGPTQAKVMIESLATQEGIEDMLLFSTDYPHWDADDTSFVARRLPSAWHDKVFYQNSLATFRWPQRAIAQHAPGSVHAG